MKRSNTRPPIVQPRAAWRRGLLLLGAATLLTGSAMSQCDPAIPYASNFSGSALPVCYTVLDANEDTRTWTFWTSATGFANSRAARYDGWGIDTPVDYLITPGLSTEVGTTYELSFKYNNPLSPTTFPAGLRVWYGNAATSSALTNAIGDLGMITSSTVTTATFEFTPGAGPVYIGFELYNEAGNAYAFQVGDISVVALGGPVTCGLPAPAGTTASAITPTSATLTWSAVSEAAFYEFEVRTSGAAGSGATGLVASNTLPDLSVDLSGVLSANTTYAVHVRSWCAVDDPSPTWSSGSSFTTPCSAVVPPYQQDFLASNSFGCFAVQNLLTPPDPNEHPYWVRATNNWGTYGFSGASTAVFHGMGFDPNTWLFLPAAELESGTEYRLSYLFGKAGNANTARFGALEVWYGPMADGTSMLASGVQLADHGVFNHPATEHGVTFTPPSDGDWYIGFRCNGSFYTSTYTVVDDIALELAPACAQPSLVEAVPAGDGLEVSWTCEGCTGDMIVEYGPASTFHTPGTDHAAGSNGTIASSEAEAPYLIEGLVPGGTYRIFVRQSCGSEHGLNSVAITATTTLPNIDCTDAIDIECGSALSAGTSSAPVQVNGLCDASTADTRGAWYAVTGTGGDFTLSTCTADGGSASFSTLISVLASDDCNAYTCVAQSAQASGCGNVTWSTAPDAYYLVYVSNHAGSGESGVFTIALECTDAPSCFAPSALSLGSLGATEASFTWVASAFNSTVEHRYELRTSGAPGSGAAGLVGSGTTEEGGLTLSTLSGSTTYTFSVSALCAEEGSSNWVTLTFTTPCPAASVPYDAAFSGATIPACFAVSNANDDEYTWVGATLAGFSNSNVAVYNNFDGYFATPNDWLITQAVNTTAGATYRISLKHRLSLNFAAGAVGLSVHMGAGQDPSDMVLLQHLGDVTSNAVTSRSVDFIGTGGPVHIAFKAGANNANNGWSFALYLGDIRVDALDCEGTPNGTALPGSPCDDGDASTWNDVYDTDCHCAGEPIPGCTGHEVTVHVRTDAQGDQLSWTIEDELGIAVATAGPFDGLNDQLVSTTVCLPNAFGDCYRLRLSDSFGDGITGGYWEVRDAQGALVLRDAFASGASSPASPTQLAAYGQGHAFCLPLGPAVIAEGSCGVFTNIRQSKVYCEEVPGASNYQFEFSDPDAGFLRRIAVPRNWVRFSEMVSSPLQNGVVYLTRVRVDEGLNGFGDDHFGAACELGITGEAFCTGLIDNPGHSTHSCHAVRTFGGSSKVWATPVAGAVQYRFRFTHMETGFLRNVLSNSYVCALNWVTAPLQNGLTYEVSVETLVNGTWSGYCGPVCSLTIGQSTPQLRLAEEAIASADLQLWPNPNNGELVNLRVQGIQAHTVAIDVIDLFGKVVDTRTLPVNEHTVQAVLTFPEGLANGLYFVRLTANGQSTTQRLVIQR